MEAYRLTVAEASGLMREGKLTPTELLESVLERIERLEPLLEAWVTIDREGARAEADELTREAEEGEFRGPLHGIPVGVKDIFYTEGLRTTMGSPLYAGFVPTHDAASVAKLRVAGAVIPGKTETTEFALTDPAPTRNPWNKEHTPGGSSSGSAAAVSSGMCPAALGSQTGGSVIRPAAFCGVVGVKPTYGLISTQGVYPLSWSLDHVGFFTRTVRDSALLLEALAGESFSASSVWAFDDTAPNIGLLRGYFEEKADIEVWEGALDAVERLTAAGADVVEAPLPGGFEAVHSSHRVIMAAEAASVHEESFGGRMHEYRLNIRGLVASGLLVPASTYLRAQRMRGRFIEEAMRALKGFDCLLTPSAPTPAPRGLDSTGDPAFNSPWSFCGFPSVTVPSGLTGEGLPLGIQLVGRPFEEPRLLGVAGLCEGALCFGNAPRDP